MVGGKDLLKQEDHANKIAHIIQIGLIHVFVCPLKDQC